MTDQTQAAAGPPSITAEQVIAAFVLIRDQRSQLKQVYEAADDKLKEKAEKLKAWLNAQMNAIGTTQLKGSEGTAYRELKRRFNGSDWGLIWAYIKENDRFDMLQKRLGEKALNDFLEETGELPPGVSVHQEYDVVIRRS